MEEYPYDRDSFFVQEHDFSNSIGDILKEVQDEVPFDSRDVIHHESSCMDGRWSDSTHDQSYIQSYDLFADDLTFSHADGSSIQPRLPKVDETVTSRKPATTLACAWPDCKVSTKRKTDLIRHINTRHFPTYSFPCQVSGCNRSFYRKDKLQEHERHSHHSEVLVSQRDVSKTTTQAVNDILALHDDESICLSTKDTILDESGSRSLGCWKFDLPGFDLDPQRSTPATEDSGGPSDDLSRTSDGLSRRGSLSTKSTSSYRTISSRNLSELRSASQVSGLACPFRKHNRQEYAIHKYKSCATSKWATVHRVK
jgi:hypothetical protein